MAPVHPTSVKEQRKKKPKRVSIQVVSEAGIGAVTQLQKSPTCSGDVTRELKAACAARDSEYRRVELATGCGGIGTDGCGSDEQDDRFDEIDFGARLGREAGEQLYHVGE